MSTQFFSEATSEWVCTRWSGHAGIGTFAVDFGVDSSRPFAVKAAVDAGAHFTDETGSSWDAGAFWRMVESAESWTFGEFGGTFELGSGDLGRFEGF